MIDYFDWMNHK